MGMAKILWTTGGFYDYEFEAEYKCPYCGTEIESWEMDDEDDEYVCESCGSVFAYQRYVTVEYCSQPLKKAECIYFNGEL